MRVFLRKLGKMVLFLILIALLLAPVVVVYRLSEAEQASYLPAASTHLEELSYGAPTEIHRRDMVETVLISGNVVGTKTLFQNLSYKESNNIRMLASPGQAVQPGDLLGYYKDEPIYAQYTGVIRQISYGEGGYIQLDSLDELALECYADEELLEVLKRDTLELQDAQGHSYQVLSIDLIQSGESGTRVLLQSEDAPLVYGQVIRDQVFQTGRVFRNALVVEERCVYHLPGGDQCYVRIVDENGKFVEELKVTTSYSDGKYICITGAKEGTFCDSGYKAVVESGGGDAGA